jgi:hypothetical protein
MELIQKSNASEEKGTTSRSAGLDAQRVSSAIGVFLAQDVHLCPKPLDERVMDGEPVAIKVAAAARGLGMGAETACLD